MIVIREEATRDFEQTENVMREAFWNHYAPGCVEHYLVHTLRKSPAFVPELSFVAVDVVKKESDGDENGTIVGATMSAKASIIGDDGKTYKALCLGPIGVLPEYQKQGIGVRLILQTVSNAKGRYRGLFLYGDPDYYSRVGFEPAEKYGIRTAENQYVDALLVREFKPGELTGITGRFAESDVYNVDENEAMEFDKKYPPKERVSGTPSQLKFLETVKRMRSYNG